MALYITDQNSFFNAGQYYNSKVHKYSFKGLPSQMQLVRTHQSRPSAAPQIKEAKMVNASTAFISWSQIKDEHHNGPLIGHQVRFL